MSDQQPKKNIFDSAIDALTGRDEKAAAEAAKKQAESAQQQAAAAQQQAAAAKIQLEQAKIEAEKNRQAAEAAQQNLADFQKQQADKDMWEKAQKAQQEHLAGQAAAAAAAAVIKHVWTKDDTYASLAQKYYGSFQEPYWRLIYEHNKAIIGDHPNAIRVGLEIEIPPLPDNLKKK
jgi:nucleoid-associated protein YgaU